MARGSVFYLPAACRQANVWTPCPVTPGTWRSPRSDPPCSSWLVAHHRASRHGTEWARSDISYRLGSGRVPATQRKYLVSKLDFDLLLIRLKCFWPSHGSWWVMSPKERRFWNFCILLKVLIQSTHISGAPLLNHGDDVSELHLQGESRLPLWLHLYVLPHLSHHRVHALKHTDHFIFTLFICRLRVCLYEGPVDTLTL